MNVVSREEGSVKGVGRERLTEVAARVPPRASVLEAGFGLACLPELLAPKECSWVGFDCEKAFVERAMVKGLSVSLGDADREWAWKNNSFDCVVLMNVLEHVENTQFVLREAKRVLRKGGVVVGTVPYAVNLKKLWYERKTSFSEDGDDLRCFGQNELLFALKRAGFEVREITRICGHLPLIHLDLGVPFLAVQLVFKAVKK